MKLQRVESRSVGIGPTTSTSSRSPRNSFELPVGAQAVLFEGKAVGLEIRLLPELKGTTALADTIDVKSRL